MHDAIHNIDLITDIKKHLLIVGNYHRYYVLSGRIGFYVVHAHEDVLLVLTWKQTKKMIAMV